MKKKITTVYGVSCKGSNQRSVNQDNFYAGGQIANSPRFKQIKSGIITETGHLYGVFDGFGDRALGYKAAKIAAEVVKSCHSTIKKSHDVNPLEFMAASLFEANDKICNATREKAGCAAAILTISDGTAVAVNVGDCRIYLYRDNQLRQISHDHTESQEMIDNQLYVNSEDEISKRYKLTQSMGTPISKKEMKPYSIGIKTRDGDIFLLCTRGGVVDNAKAQSIISSNKNDPAQISKKLAAQAVDGGSSEDATILVAAIHTSLPKIVLIRQAVAAASAVAALCVAATAYQMVPQVVSIDSTSPELVVPTATFTPILPEFIPEPTPQPTPQPTSTPEPAKVTPKPKTTTTKSTTTTTTKNTTKK